MNPKLRFSEFGAELPWRKCLIGDILSILHGRDYRDLPAGDIPVLATGGQIASVAKPICTWPCVLIGRKGTINRPQFMNEPFWSVDTLYYSKPKKDQDPKFQYYLFQTIDWMKFNEASGVPSLSSSTIHGIEIFVPEIREQEKIASFFTLLDKKIALAERKLYCQSKSRRSLEKKILSHSISVENSTQCQAPWKNYVLRDVVEYFYSGSTPKSKNDEYYRGDIPWVTSLDLNRNIVRSTGKCLSQEGFNSCNLKLLPKGSFVFSTCGVEAENVAGNCGILGMDSAISQSLMCIKPKESVASSKFLFYWYRCFGKDICKRYAHGTKQLHLNIELMSNVEIQLPSLNEQNKIVEILDSVDEKYRLLEKEVVALRKLKKAFLQQMFV